LKNTPWQFMLLNTPLYGLICVYNWILVKPLKLLNAQNELPAHISAQEESERKGEWNKCVSVCV